MLPASYLDFEMLADPELSAHIQCIYQMYIHGKENLSVLQFDLGVLVVGMPGPLKRRNNRAAYNALLVGKVRCQ